MAALCRTISSRRRTVFDCPATLDWATASSGRSATGTTARTRPSVTSRGPSSSRATRYFYRVGYTFYAGAGREAPGVRARGRLRAKRWGSTCPARRAAACPTPRGRRRTNQNYPEMQGWVPATPSTWRSARATCSSRRCSSRDYYATLANGGNVMTASRAARRCSAPTASLCCVASRRWHRQGRRSPRRTSRRCSTRPRGRHHGRDRRRAHSRASDSRWRARPGRRRSPARTTTRGSRATRRRTSPEYAVAVMIEQGGHGGSVAEPAAREILAALFAEDRDVRARGRTTRGTPRTNTPRSEFVRTALNLGWRGRRRPARLRQRHGVVGDVGMAGGAGLFSASSIGIVIGLVPLAVLWAFDYRAQGWTGPLMVAARAAHRLAAVPGWACS